MYLKENVKINTPKKPIKEEDQKISNGISIPGFEKDSKIPYSKPIKNFNNEKETKNARNVHEKILKTKKNYKLQKEKEKSKYFCTQKCEFYFTFVVKNSKFSKSYSLNLNEMKDLKDFYNSEGNIKLQRKLNLNKFDNINKEKFESNKSINYSQNTHNPNKITSLIKELNKVKSDSTKKNENSKSGQIINRNSINEYALMMNLVENIEYENIKKISNNTNDNFNADGNNNIYSRKTYRQEKKSSSNENKIIQRRIQLKKASNFLKQNDDSNKETEIKANETDLNFSTFNEIITNNTLNNVNNNTDQKSNVQKFISNNNSSCPILNEIEIKSAKSDLYSKFILEKKTENIESEKNLSEKSTNKLNILQSQKFELNNLNEDLKKLTELEDNYKSKISSEKNLEKKVGRKFVNNKKPMNENLDISEMSNGYSAVETEMNNHKEISDRSRFYNFPLSFVEKNSNNKEKNKEIVINIVNTDNDIKICEADNVKSYKNVKTNLSNEFNFSNKIVDNSLDNNYKKLTIPKNPKNYNEIYNAKTYSSPKKKKTYSENDNKNSNFQYLHSSYVHSSEKKFNNSYFNSLIKPRNDSYDNKTNKKCIKPIGYNIINSNKNSSISQEKNISNYISSKLNSFQKEKNKSYLAKAKYSGYSNRGYSVENKNINGNNIYKNYDIKRTQKIPVKNGSLYENKKKNEKNSSISNEDYLNIKTHKHKGTFNNFSNYNINSYHKKFSTKGNWNNLNNKLKKLFLAFGENAEDNFNFEDFSYENKIMNYYKYNEKKEKFQKKLKNIFSNNEFICLEKINDYGNIIFYYLVFASLDEEVKSKLIKILLIFCIY